MVPGAKHVMPSPHGNNRPVGVSLLLAALTLLLVGALIFRQFLFGNAALLYKDIGSDH